MNIGNFIFGCSSFRAEGVFCERIINIANEHNIFICDVKRTDELSLSFTVSLRGAEALLALPLPPSLTLTRERDYGLPAILSRYKKRRMLFICPVIALLGLFISTRFIWNVNVIAQTPEEESLILKELASLGVKRGALKSSIKQSDIKRRMLIMDNSLLWIWVDIKGSSAIVRIAERTQAPAVFDEDEFFNIYSVRDAVITRVIARGGTAKVSEGDTVLSGQLLIEGSMDTGDGNIKYLHASGEVYGSVWEEKTISVPKKNEIRTPTGKELERLSINFSKFNIKLFINSRIPYPKYDIIEEQRFLPLLPVSFLKTTYREVEAAYSDNDVNALIEKSKADFSEELALKGITPSHIEASSFDTGDDFLVTVKALCEENIAQERRMNFGEDNTLTEP